MLQALRNESAAKFNEPVPLGLTATGEVSEWARAIKQLVLSSTGDETGYFLVKQRGAWLASYASHILGMAVKLLLRDEVLWESAGSQGCAIFQLVQPGTRTLWKIGTDDLQIINEPQTQAGQKSMSLDYLLGESLAMSL